MTDFRQHSELTILISMGGISVAKVNFLPCPKLIRLGYPGQLNKITKGCSFRRIADSAGLTQFGVNQVISEPGGVTSLRHWHENEDEFVLKLSGTVVLIDDQGECKLEPGDCAAFKAGEANGHQFVNRSDCPAIILEIGSRCTIEVVHYCDVDMMKREDDR